MTNTIAAWLAALILLAVTANFVFGLEAHMFLARKFVDLVDWLKFWR